jgi:hypothetical protein
LSITSRKVLTRGDLDRQGDRNSVLAEAKDQQPVKLDEDQDKNDL